MISYQVFFTPKPGVEDERVTNPASFQALPRFQAIADYDSQVEMTTFSSGASIIFNFGATTGEPPFGRVEREGFLITNSL
ncbi:MAG: hypothetical protein NTV93_18765 [Verrucomicrobia bacterium]|nr:hypothetical protein [Verrucomicrobiota bacterium]